MAKIGLSLNVNVKQIERMRLVKGAKGTYLNATVFVDIDQADQYGNNGMITQDVSKEEREQGGKGNILGNCKVVWREQRQAPQYNKEEHEQNKKLARDVMGEPPKPTEPEPDFDDDIPF